MDGRDEREQRKKKTACEHICFRDISRGGEAEFRSSRVKKANSAR